MLNDHRHAPKHGIDRSIVYLSNPPESHTHLQQSEASVRGASRFQVRLEFSGSSLENTDAAIAQDNNFIEWVKGPTLVVTGSA